MPAALRHICTVSADSCHLVVSHAVTVLATGRPGLRNKLDKTTLEELPHLAATTTEVAAQALASCPAGATPHVYEACANICIHTGSRLMLELLSALHELDHT